MTKKKPQLGILTWEGWAQIPVDQLSEMVKNVFNGKNAPCIVAVDTGDLGHHAVVVSAKHMAKEAAQQAWEELKRQHPVEVNPPTTRMH